MLSMLIRALLLAAIPSVAAFHVPGKIGCNDSPAQGLLSEPPCPASMSCYCILAVSEKTLPSVSGQLLVPCGYKRR